jgi:hypothetical protein
MRPAFGEQLDCGTATAQIEPLQDAVVKTQKAALVRIMALKIAAGMASEKKREFLADYCMPEHLADFDHAQTALDDAMAGAANVKNACTDDHNLSGAEKLTQQWRQMKDMLQAMTAMAATICKSGS